jgi:hypothetical protein
VIGERWEIFDRRTLIPRVALNNAKKVAERGYIRQASVATAIIASARRAISHARAPCTLFWRIVLEQLRASNLILRSAADRAPSDLWRVSKDEAAQADSAAP